MASRLTDGFLFFLNLFFLYAVNEHLSDSAKIDGPSEIIVSSGSNFTLTCSGEENSLIWSLPNPRGMYDRFEFLGFVHKVSNYHDKNQYYDHDQRKRITTLTISDAKYLDTGYYFCFGFSPYLPGIVYIYVNDSRHLLPFKDLFIWIKASTIEFFQIPCKPTDPKVSVTLSFLNDSLLWSANYLYDSRDGFLGIMQDIPDGYNETVKCIATDLINGHQQSVNFVLWIPNTEVPEAKVPPRINRHVVVGQENLVICRAGGEEETLEGKESEDEKWILVPFWIEWIVPETAGNSRASLITEDIKTNNDTHSNRIRREYFKNLYTKLKIHNVTKPDEGEYTCSRNSNYNIYSVYGTRYFEAYSKDETFLNLKADSEMIKVNATALEKSAKWLLTSFTHPRTKVTLTWLGPNNEDLTELSRFLGNRKYGVDIPEEYPIKIVLSIEPVNVTDSGNYTVIATNGRDIKTLFLQLDVLNKPEIQELKGDMFYKTSVPKNVTCKVIGNPLSTIEWRFLECDEPESLNYCKIGQVKKIFNRNNKTTISAKYMIESSIEFDTKESGILECLASNKMGLSIARIPIRHLTRNSEFTDLANNPKGLKLFKNQNETTVGDDLVLTCTVDTFVYFSHLVKWIKKNGKKNTPVSQFWSVESSYGDNLYISTLTVTNIRKKHSGNYVCQATRIIDYEHLEVEEVVTVLDLEPPNIIETNLNNTEIVITSLPFSLNCVAKGRPTPTILWYKDEKLISFKPLHYELINNGQTLIIKSLSKDKEGDYHCKAINRGGYKESYANIKLKEEFEISMSQIIILGVVILLLTTCLISILIYCICYQKKKMKKAARIYFERGVPESINQDLPLDEQVYLLPYDPKWEFPRRKLAYGKQLGAGAFGVVMKAEAFGIIKKNQWTTVAVKMVKRHAEPMYVEALASEIKVMIYLGKHLNVVNLLGACTKNLHKQKLLVIVEFCTFGNLHQYLLSHRDLFINQIDPDSGEIDIDYCDDQHLLSDAYSDETLNITENSGPHCQINKENTDNPEWCANLQGDYQNNQIAKITTSTLVCWAYQIARGMEHLASKRVVHGDLAARNILLTEHNIVKICDFGLAKNIYNNPNYKKTTDFPLPVHWMALECIMDGIYSTESDVWSYGIVLWELFSLARKPYAEFDDFGQFRENLIKGYRMSCPLYANQFIYGTMLECWSQHPSRRPSFMELSMRLGKVLEKNVREHYVELNFIFQKSSSLSLENEGYLKMVGNTTRRQRYVNTTVRCKRALDKTTFENSKYLEMKCLPLTVEAPEEYSYEDIFEKSVESDNQISQSTSSEFSAYNSD